MHEICLEIPETHRNIWDHLGGVDTSVGGALVPKPGYVEQIYGGTGRSISQLLSGPNVPNLFGRFLRQIETFLDHLWGVDTPVGRVLAPKTCLSWANTWGVGRSISQFLLGPHVPNLLEVPYTHRNISRPFGRLTHLWAVCQHSKSGSSWANTWGDVSISAFIRAPCTKFCFKVYDTNRNISYHLGGVDTLVGRVPALKIWANLSKYMGSGEVNISASISTPCTKYI